MITKATIQLREPNFFPCYLQNIPNLNVKKNFE